MLLDKFIWRHSSIQLSILSISKVYLPSTILPHYNYNQILLSIIFIPKILSSTLLTDQCDFIVLDDKISATFNQSRQTSWKAHDKKMVLILLYQAIIKQCNLINYFNIKMTTCINCRTLVELLKKEIQDLNDREDKLIRMNNVLMEAMTKTESYDKYEKYQEKGWKQKYEQQVSINLELQKKIKHMSKTIDSNSFIDSALIDDRYRDCFKENYRSGSVTKMDKLMKTFGSSKTRESSGREQNPIDKLSQESWMIVSIDIIDSLPRLYLQYSIDRSFQNTCHMINYPNLSKNFISKLPIECILLRISKNYQIYFIDIFKLIFYSNQKVLSLNLQEYQQMGKRDHSKSRSRDRSRDKKKDRKRSHQRHDRHKHSKSKQHREQKKKSAFTDQPNEKFEPIVSKASEMTSKLHQNLYGSRDQIKNLSLMKKLNPANKNLGIGLTLVEGNSSFPMGLNTGVFSMMNDASKIKRKIPLPKDSNFNYTGILIGPKANNQKQLEERTGCRIMIRGKGAQNQTGDYEDEEDLHVLVLGDNQAQVAKACTEIERIIFSDDDTLNKLKNDQMSQYQQGIGQSEGDYNLSLTTPYGPPSDNAFILQVPNQCVGLVIGKEGESIKNIAKKSGAYKVQVATSSAPGAKTRNIFVEGEPEAVERVRKELNAIVETSRKMNNGAINGSHKIQLEVPVRLIGLIIGKGGETIKGINAKTGAFVCLSKDEYSKRNRKIVTITGTEDLCLIAKYEVQKIIQKGLINLQNSGGLTSDEAEMIKPLTPIAIQLKNLNIPIPTHIQTIQQDPTTQYVLNQTLQSEITPAQLYQTFLSTNSVVEETIIEERPMKKFVKKAYQP